MKWPAENINAMWGKVIVEELCRSGIDYFCLSPGSRSTPLTVAAARNSRARTFLTTDERGAAFHALGYARATGQPAVLICTSGTAVANYMPAVVEAGTDNVPLIILSADRPPELRESGANQTIVQPGIFGRYVRWQFEMPAPSESVSLKAVLTTVDQLIFRSRAMPPGPVHLNCMFREPLAPSEDQLSEGYAKELEVWLAGNSPWTNYAKPVITQSVEDLGQLNTLLNEAGKGVILAGRLPANSGQEEIVALARQLRWPLFADVLSGINGSEFNDVVIGAFDQLLLSPRVKEVLDGVTVLQFGSEPISKRWMQFVNSGAVAGHILINSHPARQDAAHRVSLRVMADVSVVCGQLLKRVKPGTGHLLAWFRDAAGKVEAVLAAELSDTATLNEPAAARHISTEIRDDHGLVLAASMPVRDFEMFRSPEFTCGRIIANRGASGIDGTVATACGLAAGSAKPVTLLIGDLALLHDLNSLAMLSQMQAPIVVIAVNNGGGGIFSFLPIADYDDVFETYFGTPHSLTFEHAAAMFGINYYPVSSISELKEQYRAVLAEGNPALIEISTDRTDNKTIHDKLKALVESCLDD